MHASLVWKIWAMVFKFYARINRGLYGILLRTKPMFFVETEIRLIPKRLVSTKLVFVETRCISVKTKLAYSQNHTFTYMLFYFLCVIKYYTYNIILRVNTFILLLILLEIDKLKNGWDRIQFCFNKNFSGPWTFVNAVFNKKCW